MQYIIKSFRDNPVRIGAAISAGVALLAYYVPDAAPWPLVAAFVAAILGTGEIVRSDVAPMSKVTVHADELADLEGVFVVPNAEGADDAA